MISFIKFSRSLNNHLSLSISLRLFTLKVFNLPTPMSDHTPSESVLQQSHKKTKNFQPKNNPTTSNSLRVFLCRCSQLFIIFLIQVFILDFIFRHPSNSVAVLPTSPNVIHQKIDPNPILVNPTNIDHRTQRKDSALLSPPRTQRCRHGMVYVYELPEMFNKELLDKCRDLDPWHSRCNAVSNNGLGPRATGLSGVPDNLVPSWYWTDMFAGEVMYHVRMLRHECRTNDPGSATAYYIPFYAGLAVAKYLFTNYTAKDRDWHCERMLEWVQDQEPWRRSNGSDHFIMLGRMTWDFRRSKDEDWGSSFIYMPLMKRILRLAVERDPWDRLEVSVPYPTGFHPKSELELKYWMNFVLNHERTSLFTFVGGKRKVKGDFRTILQGQCYNESGSCRVVDCSGTRCYDGTSEILEAFLGSDFCLQPRGDAYTRKSTFDCMLAGSIPVFFWKRSIERQYDWFLGDEPEKFSVFIDSKEVRNGTSIRKVLEGYSRDEVRKMREKVISLIPKFVYNVVPSDEHGNTRDAFDIAIDGVLRRFHEEKKGKNGRGNERMQSSEQSELFRD